MILLKPLVSGKHKGIPPTESIKRIHTFIFETIDWYFQCTRIILDRFTRFYIHVTDFRWVVPARNFLLKGLLPNSKIPVLLIPIFEIISKNLFVFSKKLESEQFFHSRAMYTQISNPRKECFNAEADSAMECWP